MTDPTPDEANESLTLIMGYVSGNVPDVRVLNLIEHRMVRRLGVRHVLCRYVDGSVIADVFPHSSPAFRLTYAAATVLA